MHQGKFNLFRVLSIGEKTLELLDLNTNKKSTVSRASFQRRLDAGKIYVSSYHQRGTG